MFFKSFFLSAISVAFKMLALLGINKVLAVYGGPAGLALVGNFQNLMQIATAFASGTITNGVTKYTSENLNDPKNLRNVWRTGVSLALVVAVPTALIALMLAVWSPAQLSAGIVQPSIYVIFAASIILFSFNALLLAILNGLGDLKRYVAANTLGSILSLLLTWVLAILFGLQGALMALASYQGISLVATLLICRQQAWFSLESFLGFGQISIFRGFLRLALISLVSAICVPVAHIFIREIIKLRLGIEAAGIWDATWRLSAAFLLFMTSALVVYVLPKFSSIDNGVLLWKEFLGISKRVLVLATSIAFFVYLARGLVVPLLFTSEFAAVSDLLFWQLVGDVLKVFGWLLSYVAISRLYYGVCIFSEIIYNLGFVFFVYIFVARFGLDGAVFAHFISYVIYAGFMYLIVRQRLLRSKK